MPSSTLLRKEWNMWYVIQVKTGREELVKQLIESVVKPDLYEDCLIIYYKTKRKRNQEWKIEQKKAFPGYLFMITDNIEAMRQHLGQIPEMTRILGYDGEIVPLSEEETSFIQRLAGGKECIEMSLGIQIGDQIIVSSGPLKGMESTIRKIDRHKRIAIIELKMLGNIREVTVGLEIIRKIYA